MSTVSTAVTMSTASTIPVRKTSDAAMRRQIMYIQKWLQSRRDAIYQPGVKPRGANKNINWALKERHIKRVAKKGTVSKNSPAHCIQAELYIYRTFSALFFFYQFPGVLPRAGIFCPFRASAFVDIFPAWITELRNMRKLNYRFFVAFWSHFVFMLLGETAKKRKAPCAEPVRRHSLTMKIFCAVNELFPASLQDLILFFLHYRGWNPIYYTHFYLRYFHRSFCNVIQNLPFILWFQRCLTGKAWLRHATLPWACSWSRRLRDELQRLRLFYI